MVTVRICGPGAGTALTADAQDLTGYVSSYVPSELFKLTVNDTGNALFAISGQHTIGIGGIDQRKRVYVYKYFFRNTGQSRAGDQLEPLRADRCGSDPAGAVYQGNAVSAGAVRQRGYLESMEVSDRQGDDNAEGPYELLDRYVTNDAGRTPADLLITVGDYNVQNNTTNTTLPYTVAAETELWTTWQMFTPGSTGPVLLGSTDGGNTITVRAIRPT